MAGHDQYPHVTKLPADVWFNVVRYLPVRDFLSICSTCCDLRDILSDRHVWSTKMKDLLTAVPQPHIARTLPSMSTADLKRRAIRAALLDEKWQQKDLAIRRMHSIPYESTFQDVKLLPGGEMVLILLENGSLQLRSLISLEPVYTFHASVIITGYNTCDISFSSNGRIFASFHHSINSYVFLVDVVNPCISTAAMIKPRELVGFADPPLFLIGCPYTYAAGNLIAVGYFDRDGNPCIYIRTVILEQTDAGDVAEHAVMRFDSRVQVGYFESSSVSLLSRHRLLFVHGEGTTIYQIPQCQPVSSGPPPVFVPEQIWTTDLIMKHDAPFTFSPALWGDSFSTSRSPSRSLAFCSRTHMHIIQSTRDFCERSIKTYPSHGITSEPTAKLILGFTKGISRDESDCSVIGTFCVPTSSDDLATKTTRCGSFVVPLDPLEVVIDCSFDEGTGRILVLVGSAGRFTPTRILVMDVI
ncbi:hypothetical protein JAAARDRAFT_68428 [Jaapia argillacea MUCL 33604]|uniref:F-box domain-containing protein n=1 Tax=Jaapia argillacea MUCL 33604 TaxID=933084 RepID=A0A067Q8R3_9AGAM|nr:hypothetical protein JAAARDRAFT_68428 [Jaapia argillacea MUCL 33604]